MRIVVDTSVVVGAVISPAGVSSALLQIVLMENSPLESCMSLPLALEYRDVLGRPEIFDKTPLSVSEIATIVDALESVATKIDILLPVSPSAKDPNDDFVTALVVNARAERLVSYNVKDFAPSAATWGFVVCTPGALLHELREE